MTSTELVGPVAVVRISNDLSRPFRDRFAIYAAAPRNTLDPRWVTCRNHHPACDCREAEIAENEAEQRYINRDIRRAFDQVLAGHRTWDENGTEEYPGCMCTGCQVARAMPMFLRGPIAGQVERNSERLRAWQAAARAGRL